MSNATEATATNAMVVTVSTDGKVTIENKECRWGLLTLPALQSRSPFGHERWTAKAVAECKGKPWAPKVVELTMDAGTAGAVYLGLDR